MTEPIVLVIGGTGFLGRYIVTTLAKAGYRVHILARDPARAMPLKTVGPTGRVVASCANILDKKTIAPHLPGVFAVVNCVGILFPKGKQQFTKIHAQAAEKLAQMAKAAGVSRFIHISALGVDQATQSHYARSKATGEKAVLAAFPDATIIRPSVLFGPEDNFFNMFACMARLSPFLPLIGGGNTKFQPVYVQDVASAIMCCLKDPKTKGQIAELGGPRVYRFEELLHYLLTLMGIKRLLLPLPFSIAGLLGMFLEWLPTPPLTRDQVKLLTCDNMVQPNKAGIMHFDTLGITPTALEAVVPHYISRS